jgi:hypothetical protein
VRRHVLGVDEYAPAGQPLADVHLDIAHRPALVVEVHIPDEADDAINGPDSIPLQLANGLLHEGEYACASLRAH